MKVSFTRGNLHYVFERTIDHIHSRESVKLTKTDSIELVSVFDIKFDKDVDIHAHKASISKQAWESLIKDVKLYTCSICGDYSPKGECVNKRYHFPGGKPK